MPMMVSVSGIRGIVGKDLTPPTIVSYISGFAHILRVENKKKDNTRGKPTVLIGRDTRPSGEYIHKLVEGTLNALGFNTIDIGIATTPTVLLATKKLRCTGGIAITASHNPSQWNALKFCDARGLFLTNDRINKIEQHTAKSTGSKNKWSDYAHAGHPRIEKGASTLHIQEVLNHIDVDSIRKKKFRVAVDPAGGTGCMIDREFLEALGCTVIGVYDHPESEFPREPEPVPQNLSMLEKLVQIKNADIGFAQDPDGDRLSIVSDEGIALGEEYTLVLAGEAFLRKETTEIVCNLSTSLMVERLAQRYSVSVIRTKIGEINVTVEMLKRVSKFGGEGNGGVIVPGINPCRDSIVAMGLVLELLAVELLADENRSLSRIVDGLPRFYMKKDRAAVPEMDRNRLYGLVHDSTREIFPNHSCSTQDGIKYYNNSEWLHMRTSNTEPIVRIIAESEETERTNELIGIGKKCLRAIR